MTKLKRLYVLRHAKAVPGEASADDAGRELAGRGHADAMRLGVWLRGQDMLPGMVLCSPARRTVETWHDVSQAFKKPPMPDFLATLYLACASVILAELRKARADVQSLMVIGHNPGLENLCLHLVAKPKGEKAKDRVRAMAEGLPTCALAVFDFDISSWKELGAGEGELAAYIRPKDLKD